MHNIKLPDYITLSEKEKEEIFPILQKLTPEEAFTIGYLKGSMHGSDKAYKAAENILKKFIK
jgi:hypothetical protein